ncbi:MAG: hypothetical protein Q4G71_08985 [Pseudomonadota bacterium]|nr:hypothetical protein [Pseudomonadota bacterium]
MSAFAGLTTAELPHAKDAKKTGARHGSMHVEKKKLFALVVKRIQILKYLKLFKNVRKQLIFF